MVTNDVTVIMTKMSTLPLFFFQTTLPLFFFFPFCLHYRCDSSSLPNTSLIPTYHIVLYLWPSLHTHFTCLRENAFPLSKCQLDLRVTRFHCSPPRILHNKQQCCDSAQWGGGVWILDPLPSPLLSFRDIIHIACSLLSIPRKFKCAET